MQAFCEKLFQEICSRGCRIIINDKSLALESIPKCLVRINDAIFDNKKKFTIKSLVADHAYIHLYIDGDYKYGTIHAIMLDFFLKNISANPVRGLYLGINARNFLDNVNQFILNLHHKSNDDFDEYITHCSAIKLQTYVKNKMIQEMTTSYALKFMYINNILLRELKTIIIDYLIKLDKWHNLLNKNDPLSQPKKL